jgi:DNA-binding response OmpR family regulator
MHSLLLADDDTELCDMLVQYLEAEEFAVTAVHDGEAALAEARSCGAPPRASRLRPRRP